jgi:serine/threonine protein kinase
MGDMLAYRYRIVRMIGEGAFGKVYEVQSMRDLTNYFVIKTEPLKGAFNTLSVEKEVMRAMRKESGFPKFHKLCTSRGMRCLVMERLG